MIKEQHGMLMEQLKAIEELLMGPQIVKEELFQTEESSRERVKKYQSIKLQKFKIVPSFEGDWKDWPQFRKQFKF